MVRWLLGLGGACASAFTVLAQTPVPDVLRHLPDDAACVIVIPNLQALSNAIGEFGAAAGFDTGNVPPDELLEGLDLVGDSEGINLAEPIAIGVRDDGGTALVCRLSDPEKWKSAAGVTAQKDGSMTIQTAGSSRGYVAIRGDMLLVSCADADGLAQMLKSGGGVRERYARAVRDMSADPQLVFFADGEMLRGSVLPYVAMAEQTMMAGITAGGPELEAAAGVWKWIFQQVRLVIDETDSYAAGLRIGGDGIRLEDRLRVRPGGRIAEYLAKVRPTKSGLFRGMPDVAFAAAIGCEWEVPPNTPSLSEALCANMLDMGALRQKLGEEKVKAALEQAARTHRLMTGYNFYVVGQGAGASLLTGGQYFTSDTQALREAMWRSYELSPEIIGAFGAGAPSSTELKRETLELPAKGGAPPQKVDCDVMRFAFESPDPQMQQALKLLYGRENLLYLTPVKDGLAFAMGEPEGTREAIAAAVRPGQALLVDNPRVRAALARVSPHPQICMLVDIARATETGMAFASTFGVPMPKFKLPSEPSALIVNAVYMEPNAAHQEWFVPTAAIRPLLDAAKAHKATAKPASQEASDR